MEQHQAPQQQLQPSPQAQPLSQQPTAAPPSNAASPQDAAAPADGFISPPPAAQPAVRTTNSTPTASPALFSPIQGRPNMAAIPAPQASSEGTTPLGMSNSPFLHPLQGHKVRETHKALVDTDFLTGRKMINNYEIIDELGRGVHGKVKLARNTESGENVAIKIIPRFSKKRRLGKITTRSPQDKVKREIAILKKIRHPNVVALLEVIDDPELKKIYMVLEHVELGEVVWRKKGLPTSALTSGVVSSEGMLGDKVTVDEERYDLLLENRQALKDRKRAKMSQAHVAQHDYWSLEYGVNDDDELQPQTRWPRVDEADSTTRSARSNPDSTMASRGTSRAPSQTRSARSISRTGTPHPFDPDMGMTPQDEDVDTPGPLRSNPVSSSALDGTMYGAYMEDPAFRGRSPSMADSIISHMSSIDYNRVHDPFADDFSYVPCFTIDQARSTFRDTVLGLEYLHYEGIIHRDIKPANLLWTKDHRTKISDFGVSYFGRPIRDGEADDTISESEAHDFDNDLELAKTVGTPAFFAPELCYTDLESDYPQPKITEQIDVWSLGVTLYCLIFARIPFLAEDEWQMFRKIATEDVYIPRQRLRPVDPATKPDEKSLYTRVNTPPYRDDGELTYEDIDDKLHHLLSRMLTKNPDKRIRLRDVKRHPWVTHGVDNVIGWLEDTDASKKAAGNKIQVDEREMARAVIPLTLLERARSAVKKAYGKVMHPRNERAESSPRRRAASSAASSAGVEGQGSNTPTTPVSRENRRRSLRTDDYFTNVKDYPQGGAEHPLSQSVTASPHESPLDDGSGTYPAHLSRGGSGGLPLRQSFYEGSSDSNSVRGVDHMADRSTQSTPYRPVARHTHARSVASAFLSFGSGPRESHTVPPTPLYDSPTDDPGSTLRKARDTRPAAEDSSRARSVDRGLFANNDKRAEPKVSLTTAIAPGTIEAPRPARHLRLMDCDNKMGERPLAPSPFVLSPRTPSAYQHGQPKSDPNIHQRQRLTLEQEEPSTSAQDALRDLSANPTTSQRNSLAVVADPAAIPCPPSPEYDAFAQDHPPPPSRANTSGTMISSNNTSMGAFPTPLTSPSETTSPICASSSVPSVRETVDQMLAFQSDPSLPGLLSGTSSVSADPEGEFLGSPGVVKQGSAFDTTDSLTPPALTKESISASGSPLEQHEQVQDGAIPVRLDDSEARGKVPRTPTLRAARSMDDDDDDSDSDEGLTMAKSRKKQSPKGGSPPVSALGRSLTARRRDTNISTASTETAKKLSHSD